MNFLEQLESCKKDLEAEDAPDHFSNIKNAVLLSNFKRTIEEVGEVEKEADFIQIEDVDLSYELTDCLNSRTRLNGDEILKRMK